MARRVGALRGRQFVLLWHRVRPATPAPWEVVRTVPLDRFEAQLDLIQDLGTIVPLSEVERESHPPTPRFALTFDDDDPGHAQHVLPALQARGLKGTFFLSGRWQTDAGPYWWERLEALVRSEGPDRVAVRHGLDPGATPPQLARAMTGTPLAKQIEREQPHTAGDHMQYHHARALVDAGMEIGFHTHDHHPLPSLSGDELVAAASRGRDTLAQALGTDITRFAYPHGSVGRESAEVVRRAGYRSAWTTSRRVVHDSDDPVRRGRWALEALAPEHFRSALLRGMVRPGP